MMKPTLHLNGTSAEALVEQYQRAASALMAALDALGDSAPNGRDYYPQGPDALNMAAREHRDRIHRVRSVLDEVEKLTLHCAGMDDDN